MCAIQTSAPNARKVKTITPLTPISPLGPFPEHPRTAFNIVPFTLTCSEGTTENSPAFQRWEFRLPKSRVPAGTTEVNPRTPLVWVQYMGNTAGSEHR